LVHFVEGQQDNGRDNPSGDTLEELMNKVQKRWDQMELQEQHKAVDTARKEVIMVLQAKVESLKQMVNKFKNANKSGKADKSADKPSNSSDKGDNNGKHKCRGKREPNPNFKPFPEELKKTPAPADPNVPKVIDRVKYWWCEVGKKWGKHSPDQCTLKDKKNSNTGTDSGSSLDRAVWAMMAVIEAAKE
jgi:hypothetical protein